MVKPGFDVAVVVVDRQITFNPYIQPVCLPTPETATISYDFPKQPMVVRGWGNKVFGFGKQRSAQILQELRGLKEIPLEDKENTRCCRTLLGNLIQVKSHHMRVWKERPEPANGC